MKSKEVRIVIKRISCNEFVVDGKVLDYLQLINWFREIITD